MEDKYFLKVIIRLRLEEEILLLGNILYTSEEEEKLVLEFLSNEYERECLEYPYEPPLFENAAALWAAKTVYIAAQLILYRQNTEKDLEKLLPAYQGEINSAAMLSADLCLRFLTPMISQLKLMNPEDKLVEILEGFLHQWHYSGISYSLELEQLDFQIAHSNKCLEQLYINRIIEYKNKRLAKLPEWEGLVKANLSIFSKEYWSTLD